MEGRYNQNKAQIQQVLDAYGSIDLLRDEDKQYLAGKLNDITHEINQSGNRNLAKSYVAQNIFSKVKTVAQDAVVLDAMESTSKYNNFVKQVQETKEKKPELYNDANYNFALYEGGFNDYMQGKTNKIGILNYTPFKDVQKKLNDEIYKIEQLSKEQTIQYRDGQGNIQEVKKQMLTPDEVRQIAASNLNNDDFKQIEINGWVNTEGYQDTSIVDSAKAYVKEKVDYNSAKALSIQALIDNGGLDKDTEASYKNQVQAYTNQSKELERYGNSLSSVKQAASYVEKERTIENAVKTFGGLYVESTSYKKDDVFWAQKDYELEQAKFKYQIEKDAKAEKVKQVGVSDLIVSNLPLTSEEMPDIDNLESKVDAEATKYQTSYDTTLKEYRTKIEDLSKKGDKEAIAVMALYKENLKTQTEADAFFNAAQKQIQTNSGLRILENKDGVPTNYMSLISDSRNKYKKLIEAKVQASEEAEKQHADATLNTDETFSAFYNNPNTKMMWKDVNGVEKAMPVYKVLQANGLMDTNGKKTGDLNDKKTVLENLKKSYYADDILSSQFNYGSVNQIRVASKDKISKIAKMFGESANQASQEIQIANGGGKQYIINPNSKTGQFLLQSQKNGVYDTFSFSDQSLSSDDSTINRFVKGDYRNNESYKQKLKSLYGNLPSNKSVGVSKEDKANFNRLLAVAKSDASEDKFAINSNANTINVKLDGDYVIMSQVEGTGEKSTATQTRVPKSDFIKNAPGLAQKLDFETEASFYQIGRIDNSDLVSEPVKFYGANTSSKNFKYASKVVLKNDPFKSTFLRNEDAIKFISDSHPKYSKEVSTAIQNSSKFSVNGEVNKDFDGSSYLTLYLRNTKGDVVASQDFENITDVDGFKQIIDEVPQVYYGMFVKDIIAKQELSKTAYERDDNTYLKLMESLQ